MARPAVVAIVLASSSGREPVTVPASVRPYPVRIVVNGSSARMIANPIRVPGVRLPQRAAPRMGEHNEALLREAGLDAAQIAQLTELGVIAGASAEHGAAQDTGHAAGP